MVSFKTFIDSLRLFFNTCLPFPAVILLFCSSPPIFTARYLTEEEEMGLAFFPNTHLRRHRYRCCRLAPAC
ncbi:hypothetical protein L1987_65905 [Smallanthus sonchifolius]|uniref:Uncharacterized protein n=1 Tax=Smallanthus sonchifolius TaxID=185202 RepID=A0ACB9BVW2_9ASTR|nr:hypothetical protein L1987_65905 [Smallanthus sonchifolius]